MNKLLLGSIAILILAGAGVAVTSMGKKTITIAPDNLTVRLTDQAGGGQVNVDVNGTSVEVSSDTGSASVTGSVNAGASANLPSGFPSDVPTPRVGTIISSYAGTADGEAGYTVMYALSAQEAASVVNDYQQQLEAAGFAVSDSGSATVNGQITSGLSATKGTQTVGVALVGTSGGPATLTLVVAQDNS